MLYPYHAKHLHDNRYSGLNIPGIQLVNQTELEGMVTNLVQS